MGARAARGRFGVAWSLAGAPGLGVPPGRAEGAGRLRGSSSLGRRAQAAPPSRSLLLAVEKVAFLPKTAPSWDRQRLLPLPGRSETLSLSSVLRLGFSGLFLALGSFASSISTASLHLFSTPSLFCCRRFPVPSPSVLPTAPLPRLLPEMGHEGGLLPSLICIRPPPALPCSSLLQIAAALVRGAARAARPPWNGQRRESHRAGAGVSRGLWWPGRPCGGRMGGSPAVSAGCVLLGLFIFFPIPALPVSFGGSRSREARPRWVGVLGLIVCG